jgi:hypothetical protein
VTGAYPFGDATDELDPDAERLRTTNEGFRKEDPWGFPWQPHYWCIGGDGAGEFYFIDTQKDDSTVYYGDHEDMPTSISSGVRITGDDLTL